MILVTFEVPLCPAWSFAMGTAQCGSWRPEVSLHSMGNRGEALDKRLPPWALLFPDL